jgi:Uma2 family endonuclease
MIAKLKPTEPQEYLLLHDISWQGYEQMLRELEGQHYRLTYDEGMLEIMSVSHEHEFDGELLSRMVHVVTYELRIPIHSGGSTTFKDEALEKGLEPDKCFWIQNEKRMRGKRKFVINRDPPPDLALEIEITRSALDRMGIYAALRIPEVWRCDGHTLRVYHLAENGKYREKTTSRVFPFLPPKKILEFLHQSETVDETTLMHDLAAWIREEVAPKLAKKTPKNGKHPEK